MPAVRPPTTRVTRGHGRSRPLSRAVQARRRFDTLPRSGGRVWINGRELGGPDVRYGHLGQTHD